MDGICLSTFPKIHFQFRKTDLQTNYCRLIRFRIEEALRGEQDGEGQGRNGQETDQRIFP